MVIVVWLVLCPAATLNEDGLGDKLTFTVKRGDKTQELTVELGKGL